MTKTINVSDKTKIKVNILRAILNISNDELINYMIEELPNLKKFIEFDKDFKPVVTKKLN